MKVDIIAEIAQGFEGDFQKAKLFINAASKAGANCVKFQLVYADELATPDYQYYKLFKTLEMSDDNWNLLANYSKECNINLSLDIFGLKSLELSEKIGVHSVKLHPTDITNISLLENVSNSNINKIILGVGGANLDEIENALNLLKNKNIDLLLGFQAYPTENKDNDISRLITLKKYLQIKYKNFRIGFADHAPPNNGLKYGLACAAIGAGAEVLEKHLTLGKVMKMEDHESALNPDEFDEFVYIINECASAFGKQKQISNDFQMSLSEKQYRKNIRRHVVSSRDLKKGTVIKPSDLILKRSSSDDIIYDMSIAYDKILTKDIKFNTPLNIKMLNKQNKS